MWPLLSHVRELPPGDTIEIFTDDCTAVTDIPSWVQNRHWHVERERRHGYVKFSIERPPEITLPAI